MSIIWHLIYSFICHNDVGSPSYNDLIGLHIKILYLVILPVPLGQYSYNFFLIFADKFTAYFSMYSPTNPMMSSLLHLSMSTWGLHQVCGLGSHHFLHTFCICFHLTIYLSWSWMHFVLMACTCAVHISDCFSLFKTVFYPNPTLSSTNHLCLLKRNWL